MLTTGIGSLPGTDYEASVRLVLEGASLPWVPELPARGPWASMIGRTLAVLDGLDAHLVAGQWTFASHPGVDMRRARAMLRDDLDLMQDQAAAYEGPLKIAVCGPWTLDAEVFRPLGGRILGDDAARWDLAQSLAQGTQGLLERVQRRIPGAEIILQVDEPSLPAVIEGGVPTEGGYFRHRAIDEEEIARHLALLTSLGVPTVVHCCAGGAPLELLARTGVHGAGFSALALDGAVLTPQDWDVLGGLVEGGTGLYLGVGSPTVAEPADVLTRRALGWLRPLELGPTLADRLVLTHGCGLAHGPERAIPRMLNALSITADRLDTELRA